MGINGEGWLGLSGLLSIAFGALMIARPTADALSVLWILAAYAVVFGTVLICPLRSASAASPR